MRHKEVKDKLLSNPEVKKAYDDLEVLYEIKRQVIALRREKGLNQNELAERIGTQQSAISRLENEDYNPSIELLNRIAKAFDKKLEITIKDKSAINRSSRRKKYIKTRFPMAKVSDKKAKRKTTNKVITKW